MSAHSAAGSDDKEVYDSAYVLIEEGRNFRNQGRGWCIQCL
jgi:hypothetical protein